MHLSLSSFSQDALPKCWPRPTGSKPAALCKREFAFPLRLFFTSYMLYPILKILDFFLMKISLANSLSSASFLICLLKDSTFT